MSHWIIAPVILPAVMAALIVLLMRNDLLLQRVFGLAATLALGAISIALLHAAATGTPEVYRLGDWPAPFGIVVVLDRLSALMVGLTAFLAVLILIYAIGSDWDARGRHFHALFQFQLMGLCGAFLTGDAFNLFVFFEVLLIASYGLMIHAGGRQRLQAGLQYVAFNLFGSALFLFALATLYAVTGTLNMADLAVKVALLPEGDAALLRVAAVLLLLVFAIKGALVPLQFWLPGTYANAPGPVAALFAVMTKVGAYAMLRFGTLVFPPGTPATGNLPADILMPAAIATLILGATGVLGAASLMRLAAFAAITSMGTLFVAIAIFTPASSAAALYYLLHSTLATAILFLVADLVVAGRGSGTLLAARPPLPQNGLLSSLFFVSAIAVAGMPPLSGFVGKLLVLDATRGQMALVWPAILLTSLVVIVGFAQAGSALFWKTAEVPADRLPRAAPVMALLSIGGLMAGLAGLTILAGPVTAYLGATTESLYDTASYIAANGLEPGG